MYQIYSKHTNGISNAKENCAFKRNEKMYIITITDAIFAFIFCEYQYIRPRDGIKAAAPYTK